MTQVLIILAAICGVMLGALMLAGGFFFWYLLKIVRRLNETVEAFTRTLDPLIKTGALQTLAGSAAQMVAIGNQVLAAMKNINTTVGLFNKAFFNKEALGSEAATGESVEETFADKDESKIYSYNESDQATLEMQGKLRKVGIETDPERAGVPSLEKMKGGTV